jgi:hypothetical protein
MLHREINYLLDVLEAARLLQTFVAGIDWNTFENDLMRRAAVMRQLEIMGIEAMLGLSELKQTRVYQEALEEGKQEAKLETIPRMMQMGFNLEQIAQALEIVRQVATKQSPTSS